MNSILVTGANGQLGSELKVLSAEYTENSYFFTDINDLDITDYLAVENFIQKNKIDVIVNCAAYTAVDKAESEFEINEALNNLAVANFAKIAKENSIKLVQISTDYVFDGEQFLPYIKTDLPNPKNIYGKTKLDGELAMQNENPANSIIIRTSWVYSSFGNNFVKTMLRLGNERETLSVIFDQVGSPTYAADLAGSILEIIPKIKSESVEMFHYSNEGVCSWYDFAKAIFELEKIECAVLPIPTTDYPTPAKRPHYTVLNKAKIKNKYTLTIPYWKDSLKECLGKLKG